MALATFATYFFVSHMCHFLLRCNILYIIKQQVKKKKQLQHQYPLICFKKQSNNITSTSIRMATFLGLVVNQGKEEVI